MEKIKLKTQVLNEIHMAIQEAIKEELQLGDNGFDIDSIENIEVSAWVRVFYNRLVEEEREKMTVEPKTVKAEAELKKEVEEERFKESKVYLRGAIFNVSIDVADTEYSQELPPNTKKFLVKSRGGYGFRLAFETGKVASSAAPYLQVDSPYYEDFLQPLWDIYKLTLYLASATAGDVIEIVAWS